MELLAYFILVAATLLSPNVNGRVIENSARKDPGVTHGQFVGNASIKNATKTACEEEKAIQKCRKENAKCTEVPVEPGYVCYCGDRFAKRNGICVDMCKEVCGKKYVDFEVECYQDAKDDTRITCACYADYLFDYDTKSCKAKKMCEDEIAILKCQKENAKCLEVPEIRGGYLCRCDVGFTEINGICVEDKCKAKCGDDYEDDEITCNENPTNDAIVTCSCKDQEQLFDYAARKCRAKTTCDEEKAIKECQKINAKCALLPTKSGFVCHCGDGFEERNGICVDKCKLNCGDDYEADGITCDVDPKDATTVMCTCKDPGQLFDYDTRKCREDMCTVKCGKKYVDAEITCDVDPTDATIVTCSCKYTKQTFDYDTKKCKAKTACEEKAIKACQKKNAKCALLPVKPGYRCHCDYGFEDIDGICVEDMCMVKCGKRYFDAEITCDVDPTDVTIVTCSCKYTKQTFDYGAKTCRTKTACDEEKAIKACQKKYAKCALVPIKPGYVCHCDDGFTEINGVCMDKICIEECGVADGVKCKVVAENPPKVECFCDDPTKSFDGNTRECKAKTKCDEEKDIIECQKKKAKCALDPEKPAGYVCNCEDGFVEKGGICEAKTACDDGNAIKACQTKKAICVLDPAKTDGYVCNCDDGFVEKEDGICEEKTACDEMRVFEKCRRKNAACVVDTTAVEGFRCVCDIGYFEKNGICTKKTVCDETRAFEKCRWKGATCVVDATAVEGFRCVCDIGYFEKNGVCTKKTACDETRAFEKCRWKGATCVVDATAVEGFRCLCDIGYFEKNGVCTRDDRNQKFSLYPHVIVLVLLLIVILLLLFVGFCNIRINQRLKTAHCSVPDVK